MVPSTLSSLTTMLRRAGLLRDDEVARVEAHCRAHGEPPVVALCAMGLVLEAQLVRFLHSKLMVPSVTAEILERLDPETVAQVPAELAWQHLVLPVSMDEVGNLTLAMADPTDLAAVEAVTAHTRSYLIRAVAALSELRGALEHYHGPAHPSPAAEDEPGAPTLVPLTSSAMASMIPRLAELDDRDAITGSLLDLLGQSFERVLLFVHAGQQLRGHDGRGSDLVHEAIVQVRIPTETGPSLFADVIERQAPYMGHWPTERPIDRAFAHAMGGIQGPILLLPIVVGGRVPLVVFAMGTQVPIDGPSIEAIVDATGTALERAIRRRKQQS